MAFDNLRRTSLDWNEIGNFGTTLRNAGSAAISTIAQPIKTIGNGMSDFFNTNTFFATQPQNIIAKDWIRDYEYALKNNNTAEKQRLYSQLEKNGMRYDGTIGKIYQGDNVIENNAIIGQIGGGFNWGHTLENTGNLLGVGLSGWDLYQNISTYGDRKALLKETKENVKLKNEQLRADMENMAKERARLDTMRSNAVAQRSGSSSISGW